MASNFAFLEHNIDTQDFYDTAKNAEDLYAIGKFDNEYESIRKVAENVARMLLDLNYVSMGERSTFNDCLREIKHRHLAGQEILDTFYQLKNTGNSAAHTLHKFTKSEGLQGLRQLYTLLVWFTNTITDEQVSPDAFVEPNTKPPIVARSSMCKLLIMRMVIGQLILAWKKSVMPRLMTLKLTIPRTVKI